MSNPVLDQFRHEIFSKASTVILVCGIAAILLRILCDWLERKATRMGRARRAARDAEAPPVRIAAEIADDGSPRCPDCGGPMVKRRARRGTNAGSDFWGCAAYPRCRGTRAL